MKPTSYEARLTPLSTDALVQERVTELIGRALRRQLWLLFLDDQDVQLPILIPIEGIPMTPGARERDELPTMLRQLAESADAHSLIFVIERYGSSALTPSDVAWAQALHDACVASGVVPRAIMLSHRRGVRWLAQDDYRF